MYYNDYRRLTNLRNRASDLVFHNENFWNNLSYNKALREQNNKYFEFLKNPKCLFELTNEKDSFRKKFIDAYTLEDIYHSIYKYNNTSKDRKGGRAS